jgi:hypothetical protein
MVLVSLVSLAQVSKADLALSRCLEMLELYDGWMIKP